MDQCRLLSIANLSAPALAELAGRIEEGPFEQGTCLCEVMVEVNFRQCPAEIEGPGGRAPTELDPPCYGDRYEQVRDALEERKELIASQLILLGRNVSQVASAGAGSVTTCT